jgi:hypothetical protein
VGVRLIFRADDGVTVSVIAVGQRDKLPVHDTTVQRNVDQIK